MSTGVVSLWFLLFEVRYELCKADNPVALERQLAPCSCDSTAGKAQLPQKFLCPLSRRQLAVSGHSDRQQHRLDINSL